MVQPGAEIAHDTATVSSASGGLEAEVVTTRTSSAPQQSMALILHHSPLGRDGHATLTVNDTNAIAGDFQSASTVIFHDRSTQQHQPLKVVTWSRFFSNDSNDSVPLQPPIRLLWRHPHQWKLGDDACSSPRISDRELEAKHHTWHLSEITHAARCDNVKLTKIDARAKKVEQKQKSSDDQLNEQLESTVRILHKQLLLDPSLKFVMHGDDDMITKQSAATEAAKEEPNQTAIDLLSTGSSMKTLQPSETLPSYFDNNPIHLLCIPHLLFPKECRQCCCGHIDTDSTFGLAQVGSLFAPHFSPERQSQIRRLSQDSSLALGERLFNYVHWRGGKFRLEFAHHVKYEPGDYWNAHYSNYLTEQNPRRWTLVVFLNDMDEGEGGELRFPALDVQFQPRTGWSILWEHCDQFGNLHPEALFESAVVTGQKAMHVIYLHLHLREFQNVHEEIASVA